MEAFVITLREGVEAALIIGIIIIYLNRTNRPELHRWVYAGLGLAILASFLGAFGFSRIGLNPESEMFEGVLYAVAAVLVVSLVVWMWRASRNIKSQIEGRLDKLTAPNSQRNAYGLMIFVFFMVFREGIETVLFLAALSLTRTPDLVGLVGGLFGLGLAVLFGVLFIRGSLRVNLRWFFAVTGFVLLVLAVRLAAGSLHEFYEAGVLPLPLLVEELVELVTDKRTSTLILIALVVLPVMTMLPKSWLKPFTGKAVR